MAAVVPSGLAEHFQRTRAMSEALVEPLSDADATVQSMPDASPAKWHLAHTTWFFETFLLRDHLDGYRLFDERFGFLFNSYYEAEGPRHARNARGMLSRPALADVLDWRAHVDEAMVPLFDRPELAGLIELGVNHEQQHQEMLLTDIKHALWCNPLGPAYLDASFCEGRSLPDTDPCLRRDSEWVERPGGVVEIGHDGQGFAFDNEGPCHKVMLEPFALSNRLVSNGEWDHFISDGGYSNPALWLSDGWAWVQDENVTAPLYWRDDEHFTLSGWRPRNPDAPVAHISYYEADAFSTWLGHRLPTEFEWEVAASGPDEERDLFGQRWQWTRSAYLPYPRYRPAAGAVGEYNGKFMSGQFVLKGASCATPRGHSRASYRNFFYPHQRWQFTGLRLAKDL